MAELLLQVLSEVGYSCGKASNGSVGLRLAPDFELLLVDVMMPVMNGFEMVKNLREQGLRIPIIFLTAKDATKDVVSGLEFGADDYIVKPFKLDELIARVKAALRRARESSPTLSWFDLNLNCANRTARRGEFGLFLSATEFALLELFVRRPETVLSKSLILSEVWQDTGYRDENIVETYVTYLRRKTEARGATRVIHTVRGRGYILALAAMES